MAQVAASWRSVLERKWAELASAAAPAPSALRSTDLLLPAGAGTLHVALDADGRRHVLVPYTDEEVIPDDRRSSGIHLGPRRLLEDGAEALYADVVCVDRDLSGVFASLAVSVVELFAAAPTAPPHRLHSLLGSWRRLLAGRGTPWTVSKAGGLFGELIVLRRLLEVSPAAVSAWRGPMGEPQDFRSARHAIEVKTTTTPTGRVVSVHGLDQLESLPDGVLTLAWLRLAGGGQGAETIMDVAEACRSRSTDPQLFDDLLALIGWPTAPDDVRSLAFSVVEERWYTVSASFPRLSFSDLVTGAAPPGVSSVNYQLDLDYVPADYADAEDAIEVMGADL